jgi:hypothetical protein
MLKSYNLSLRANVLYKQQLAVPLRTSQFADMSARALERNYKRATALAPTSF